jgi:hypothetical protein
MDDGGCRFFLHDAFPAKSTLHNIVYFQLFAKSGMRIAEVTAAIPLRLPIRKKGAKNVEDISRYPGGHGGVGPGFPDGAGRPCILGGLGIHWQ